MVRDAYKYDIKYYESLDKFAKYKAQHNVFLTAFKEIPNVQLINSEIKYTANPSVLDKIDDSNTYILPLYILSGYSSRQFIVYVVGSKNKHTNTEFIKYISFNEFLSIKEDLKTRMISLIEPRILVYEVEDDVIEFYVNTLMTKKDFCKNFDNLFVLGCGYTRYLILGGYIEKGASIVNDPANKCESKGLTGLKRSYCIDKRVFALLKKDSYSVGADSVNFLASNVKHFKSGNKIAFGKGWRFYSDVLHLKAYPLNSFRMFQSFVVGEYQTGDVNIEVKDASYLFRKQLVTFFGENGYIRRKVVAVNGNTITLNAPLKEGEKIYDGAYCFGHPMNDFKEWNANVVQEVKKYTRKVYVDNPRTDLLLADATLEFGDQKHNVKILYSDTVQKYVIMNKSFGFIIPDDAKFHADAIDISEAKTISLDDVDICVYIGQKLYTDSNKDNYYTVVGFDNSKIYVNSEDDVNELYRDFFNVEWFYRPLKINVAYIPGTRLIMTDVNIDYLSALSINGVEYKISKTKQLNTYMLDKEIVSFEEEDVIVYNTYYEKIDKVTLEDAVNAIDDFLKENNDS